MPGNEVGDRVHNFFAQDNLSQGLHSQAAGANWPSVNNLWVGNQKQLSAPSSNPRFCNPQQSEIEHVPVPHGFNFMQTTSRPEFANNQSQDQQQNLNGYMYGRHALHTRPDEENFLGLDTDSNQNNMNPRGFLGYDAQHEGVSEQISKNLDRSDAFDANGSLDLFGRQNQMNNQHPGSLQQVQNQQSGFNDRHLQQQFMLRKMQEIQRQKSIGRQNSVNEASRGLINGTPTSESPWAELPTGSTNWLQRSTPMVQPELGQAQRSMAFVNQQVDHSLYGVPVSSSRDPLNPYYVAGNSFPGNQYARIPEQVITQDGTGTGTSVSRQGVPGKSLFGHTSGQGSNSGINMEQIQQLKPVQPLQDKPEVKATSSHGAASLDPDEEKFLFGQDGNIWDAFGSNEDMGGGISNLLDDNEFSSGLPSLQGGSWSALMQSAAAETTSSGIGSQDDWTGLNQQTPLADVNLPNVSAMVVQHRDKQNPYVNSNSSGQLNQHSSGGSKGTASQQYGNGLPNDKQNDWNTIDSVPPRGDTSLNMTDNLLQQFPNNNRKRVMHEEIGHDDGIWRVNNAIPNPNVDLESINNTSMGSPQINREGGIPNLSNVHGGNHFGQLPSNNHQLNYWKHVQSSVNLSKSQLHPNKGPQVSESSFNSSDKEDLKMHEIESRSKRENSNDSYQSSSSHQANTARLRENSLDGGDLRPLPWTKQSLLNQVGRKTSGARKFQYHPMGNLDEDVEVPYGARQASSPHFQANLGHAKISGQVPTSSAEMGKGRVNDLEGVARGSHDMRSKGMIGGQVPNMFAPFDKSVGLSTPEKASQPSQNMLELLHKVDKSRDGGTTRHFNSSERHLSSEMAEPEYSDGSFGGLQRSHSSNSQGPSLQLGPPSQRLPLHDNSTPSNVSIVNSSSLSQAAFPSLLSKNNRIGSSEQNASEISTHKMPANLSSSFGTGFPNSRSQLQNRQMMGARGLESTNNSDNESLNRRTGQNNIQSLEGRLPNKASFGRYNDAASSHMRVQAPSKMSPNLLTDQKEHLNLFQSPQLNIVESTSFNNQEAEKRGNMIPNVGSSSLNLLSGKVGQGQTTNGPLGKESVIDPVSDSLALSPAATQTDLEAFGRSLKPNNFHQNSSLMNQTSTMTSVDNDPCNRAMKKLKGADTIEQNMPFDMLEPRQNEPRSSVSSNNITSIKAEHSHISPQMAPSWFDQYGTFKNNQVPQRVDAIRSIEQPFNVGRLSGGLEVRNSKEQAGPDPPLAALERSSAPLPTKVGVENVVAVRPKKRRLVTDDFRSWLVEVSGGSKNLQGICTGAEEWASSANRIMEKVDDDGEVIEDTLPMPRPKRRLISTTLLMQQLLRPPPTSILSTDASLNHESVVYYVARRALGDACNLVSSAPGANCQSDKGKTSERIDDDHLSKIMQDFVSKAGKLEYEFLRLDKRASILDLRVENQDVERFSVITRFARFHGRAQTDVAEASSSDAGAHTQRLFPQRYVTAVALPTNLPDKVQCLSL